MMNHTGEYPWAVQSSETTECQVLNKLLELGITDIYGHSIQKDLLPIAEERQQAWQALRKAEEKFQWMMKTGQAEDLRNLDDELNKILTQLQEVKEQYPSGPEFYRRRQEVESDIARVEELRAGLRQRVRTRGIELLFDFYASITSIQLGNEQALAEAQNTKKEIDALHQKWPDTFSQDEIERMRRRLEEAKARRQKLKEAEARRLQDQLDRSNQLLRQAKQYRQTQPQLALTYLAQAREILEILNKDGPTYEGWSALFPQVQEAKKELEILEAEVRKLLAESLAQSLAEQLADQQKQVLQKGVQQARNNITTLQDEIQQAWKNWKTWDDWQISLPFDDRPSTVPSGEEANRFLGDEQYGPEARKKLDEIRFFLALTPETELPDWVQTLLRVRQDNLLHAAILYRQVHAVWTQEENQTPFAYWAWQRIELAHQYDPDSPEISNLHTSIEKKWKEMENRFDGHIEQARRSLGWLGNQGTPLPNRSTPSELLKTIEQSLEEAEKMLKEQVEKPGEWEKTFRDTRDDYERLHSLWEQEDGLKKGWEQKQIASPRLVEQTVEFLHQKGAPFSLKESLRQAMAQAIRKPGVFATPSLALKAYKTYKEYKTGSNTGQTGRSM
ncbi:MAG: hypothetical protein D6784_17860 [Chloroflexi bacterium]|nr:MAG: hypothetical protein D6784_17860 [Chloroflexota bacterium]